MFEIRGPLLWSTVPPCPLLSLPRASPAATHCLGPALKRGSLLVQWP